MSSTMYEYHVHSDPDFPIIFHYDSYSSDRTDFIMHWHENIEMLYFRKGKGIVTCDITPVQAEAGDLVIVNSCTLHSISSLTPSCNYYCLIADKAFCEAFDLPVGEVTLKNIVNNEDVCRHFERIACELTQQAPYYKSAVKAEVISLLAMLFRMSAEDIPLCSANRSKQLNMVREAITYLRQHYKEPLSVDDICHQIGYSKYYFCRVFHQITGKTAVDYMNYLRCEHARKLLKTGLCNVSESAERSGFHNLSYFTKTYKHHMGELPSDSLS